MKTVFVALLLTMLGTALAQTPTLTPQEENSILKAQHETDALTGQIKDMQAQFAQLQAQAQQLQQKFPVVQQQLKEAERKVDVAVDAIYKSHGVTKEKMDFDRSSLKFKEKAEAKKKQMQTPVHVCIERPSNPGS